MISYAFLQCVLERLRSNISWYLSLNNEKHISHTKPERDPHRQKKLRVYLEKQVNRKLLQKPQKSISSTREKNHA